jgi:O-antigen/teichoic acid export membrane protein
LDATHSIPAPAEGQPVPRRVWRGTALLVLGRFWGSACTLFTLLLLAHHLSPEDFGRYTFFLAVFMVLDSLADFGTGQVAVQRTAGDESAIPAVLTAARRIRFVTGSIGVVLVGFGAVLSKEEGAGWILLASFYPLTHIFELSATVFRNRIAWGIPVAMRAIAAGLSLTFVLLLYVADERSPARYLFAVALGSASANGLLHWASRKHLPKSRVAAVPVREILVLALPLGIASLCQQAYFYIDNLFVRAMLGPEPLGHYNIGVRVMSYGIMVAIYATQAALPWLARRFAAGDLDVAIVKLSQPLFALAGFGAGLAWPWSEQLLSLFGAGFDEAGPSLRWLLAATATVYAGAGLMTALVAAAQMRAILVIAAGALVVNVVANMLLIPRMQLAGAGAATLITEVTVTIGAAIALARIDVNVLRGVRAIGWLGGPVGFAVAALLSSLLPIASH